MFATTTDVATFLGRHLNGAEEEQVQLWLKTVEAAVLARVPDMAERIEAGEISADLVRSVVAGVVVRRVNNPSGMRSERIDDYSYSLASDAASASLWLTEDEWALLMPSRYRGAFSVRPAFQPTRGPRWLCR